MVELLAAGGQQLVVRRGGRRPAERRPHPLVKAVGPAGWVSSTRAASRAPSGVEWPASARTVA
ncbi:hypothetical protein ACIRBZ_46925 [Streptomyces sp. NPDC094038]|uniref:hypothetical protein n=1 Tax=Streptomyces sp. NPDC094038 TaxID=3366055 RepID=UPI0038113FA4